MPHKQPTGKRASASNKTAGKRPNGRTVDAQQYQRFLEAAQELGCEGNAERMDEVVRRAAKLSPEGRLPRAKEGK